MFQDGLEAEKMIYNYYDSLIFCMNPVGKECWQKSLIYPCKETLKEVMRDLLHDYIDIVYKRTRNVIVHIALKLTRMELSTADFIIHLMRVL